MPNLNSIIGGITNVANQIKSAQSGSKQQNQGSQQGGSSYPNQGGYSSGGSTYPNQSGGSAYPNQGGGSAYSGSSAYPNQGSGSAYSGSSGYPNQGTPSGQPQAYQGYKGPQGGGMSGYPGQTPYPGQGGQGGQGGQAPYPSQGGNTAPYPGYDPQPIGFNVGFAPPSGQAPYPSANQAPYPGDNYGFPQSQHQQSPYPQSQHGSYPIAQPMGYGAMGAPYQQHQHQHQQHYQQQQPSAPPQYQTSYVPGMYNTPSVRPVPSFNANADAEVLRNAMKGFGCNKDKVVAILCGRSNWQRQEISKAFKVMYGKDLIKDLKSELSGDFEDLILALMEPPAKYDAQQLHKAMAGLGTTESVLIEIMTTRTNAQIFELKSTYQQLYGKELERDLIGETSGTFKRLLVSLCAAGRDEGYNTDALRANQDARKLYRAGEQRLGTDESCFNAILASQNFAQLRLVFDEYEKVTKHPIEKALESEFSGDTLDGFRAVVKCIRNRAAYFAELLYNSMKGLGTRDNDLIRLVVTRSEIDLQDVRNAYQQMYKTSLESAIAGDCSGAYKDGLIALVKGNH